MNILKSSMNFSFSFIKDGRAKYPRVNESPNNSLQRTRGTVGAASVRAVALTFEAGR